MTCWISSSKSLHGHIQHLFSFEMCEFETLQATNVGGATTIPIRHVNIQLAVLGFQLINWGEFGMVTGLKRKPWMSWEILQVVASSGSKEYNRWNALKALGSRYRKSWCMSGEDWIHVVQCLGIKFEVFLGAFWTPNIWLDWIIPRNAHMLCSGLRCMVQALWLVFQFSYWPNDFFIASPMSPWLNVFIKTKEPTHIERKLDSWLTWGYNHMIISSIGLLVITCNVFSLLLLLNQCKKFHLVHRFLFWVLG